MRKRDLRRRAALRVFDEGDVDEHDFVCMVRASFPAKPPRRAKRHLRQDVRAALQKHRARRARYARRIGLGDKTKLTKAKDRVQCSCPMCGNPRRWWGEKPISELRLDDQDAAQLN